MEPIYFDTKFGYKFGLSLNAIRNKVHSNRMYLPCWRVLQSGTKFYVGRLELNPNTRQWKLGIALGTQHMPSARQIANLEAWANRRISRKRSKLLEKLQNDNATTMA